MKNVSENDITLISLNQQCVACNHNFRRCWVNRLGDIDMDDNKPIYCNKSFSAGFQDFITVYACGFEQEAAWWKWYTAKNKDEGTEWWAK